MARDLKPLVWIGSAKGDLKLLPREIAGAFGFALYEAQKGAKHPNAKPLRGFGGAGVLEVVESRDGGTYRAVYAVRLAGRVYVLHVFQKKSKSGVATPRHEIEKIKQRLKLAEELHAAWSLEEAEK